MTEESILYVAILYLKNISPSKNSSHHAMEAYHSSYQYSLRKKNIKLQYDIIRNYGYWVI